MTGINESFGMLPDQHMSEIRSSDQNEFTLIINRLNLCVDTINSLEKIKQDAACGDMPSILALNDFDQSINDTHYKITYAPSKKILKKFDLLDDNDQLRKEIRDVLMYPESD